MVMFPRKFIHVLADSTSSVLSVLVFPALLRALGYGYVLRSLIQFVVVTNNFLDWGWKNALR